MSLEGRRARALTVGEVLRRSTEHLDAKGSETPRLDAELLLAHALGLTRIELYMHLDRPLDADELDAARALVARRAAARAAPVRPRRVGVPAAHARVDRRALIPRPETEIVVERCLALLAATTAPRVLDVGTGSGAIALAIADEHPGAQVTGIDVSRTRSRSRARTPSAPGIALALARHDLFAGLPAGPWELVVSNPPYVDPDEREPLQPEVRDWEPAAALFGREADGGRRPRRARRARRRRRARARGRGRAGGRRSRLLADARLRRRRASRPISPAATASSRGAGERDVDAAVAALRAGELA